MARGFSPLDETLKLLPGQQFTPWLVESIVRLGACLPFGQVPALIAHFTGVEVGVETVRRLTEAAGAAQVAREQAELERIEAHLPAPPAGPAIQQLSVDGAMVPLVGGEWREVKTLVLGTVRSQPQVGKDPASGRQELSYFARLSDAATFGRLATLETHRRGTLRAGTVVAVNDGAVWIQEFIDLHRPDAVRILDFAHAVGYLGQVAQALFGAGSEAASAWVGEHAHALRHGQQARVLGVLAVLAEQEDLASEAAAVVAQTAGYLASRREQIRYGTFAAAGYPIGSGCVESANKLLVEARLKGAGMHWRRDNVDVLLALRCLERNGRWEREWPALWGELRCQARLRARARRRARRPAPADPPPVALPPPVGTRCAPPARPKTIVNGKPTADHPWRRSSPIRAKR